MPRTECCVPLCNKRGGHVFPWSNKQRMKLWTIALRRDKWVPTKKSVVCYDHFAADQYVERTTYALANFVEQAEKYQDESDYDIVSEYCQNANECEEIFQLLDGKKRKTSENVLIFQVLECILLRTADDLAKFTSVGHRIISRFLTSHMGSLYSTMGMTNKSGQIKTALKLLVAMVMQGEAAARDIQTAFKFDHYSVQPLLNRRNAKDKEDARTWMLRFMVSFLVTGDDYVKKALVETKGFLNSMFAGMSEDKAGNLQMILPVILENIIKNPIISKTSKIRLFNEKVLNSLSKLYIWTGEVNMEKVDPKHRRQSSQMDERVAVEIYQAEETEEQKVVRDLVHEMLLVLCCDTKCGINFLDKSYATTGKNLNHILTNFLRNLKQPWLNRRMIEIVTKILTVCPDQLYWYLPIIKHALSPRDSASFVSCMQFLRQIYESQADVSSVVKLTDIPVTKQVAMAVNTLIPPPDVWGQVVAAVKNRQTKIQFEGLLTLHVILQRVSHTIEYCKNFRSLSSPAEFSMSLQQATRKVIPDITVIMQCWDVFNVCQKNVSLDGESSKEQTESDMDTTDISELSPVSSKEHKLVVLKCLCVYSSLLPDVLRDQPIDFKALLEGVREEEDEEIEADEKEDESQDEMLLQLHILKLLSESDVRQLGLSKDVRSGRSLLYLLLEMIVRTADTALAATTVSLIHKMLLTSGVFDDNDDELQLWLQEISRTSSEMQADVLAFVEKALALLQRNPYDYLEQVAERGGHVDTPEAELEVSSQATTDAIVDAVLSVEEVVLEDEKEQNSTEANHHTRLPFSGLVPVCLSLIERDSSIKPGPVGYVCAVLEKLLSTQVDPRPLCSMLREYKRVLQHSNNLLSLVNICMEGHSSPQIQKTKGPVTWLTLQEHLEYLFINGIDPSTDCEDLLSKAGSVYLQEVMPLVNQTLLYLTVESQNIQSSSTVAVPLYIQLLVQLLSSQKDNNDDSLSASPLESSFSSLKAPKLSKECLLTQAYTSVLSNPTIINWFLSKVSKRTPKASLKKSFMKEVSLGVARIIAEMPENIFTNTKEDLKVYENKIRELLGHDFKIKTTDIEIDVIAETLKGLLKIVHTDMVVEIAESFTSLQSLIKQSEGDVILSSQGRILLQSVRRMLDDSLESKTHLPNISYNVAKTIFNLSSEISCSADSEDVVSIICILLEQAGFYSVCVTKESFYYYLVDGESHLLRLCCQLLRHSTACHTWFKSWCLTSKMFENNPLKYSIVVEAYLKKCDKGAPVKLLQKKIFLLYKGHLLSAFKIKPPQETTTSQFISFAQTLLSKYTQADLEKMWPIVQEAIEIGGISTSLMKLLIGIKDKLVLLESSVFSAPDFVDCLCKALIHGLKKKQLQPDSTLMELILQTILQEIQVTSVKCEEISDLLRSSWMNFVKYGLRNCFTRSTFMQILTKLIPIMYKSKTTDQGGKSTLEKMSDSDIDNDSVTSDEQSSHQHGTEPTLSTLYEMILSHSQFLSVILDKENNPLLKELMVELLLDIVHRETSCCKTAHIPVFLGAYNATLSKIDRTLLSLLHIYENNQCTLTNYRPYTWGQKAMEEQSLKSSGKTMLKDTQMVEVLEHLQQDCMQRSIIHFPIKRRMQDCHTLSETGNWKEGADVYDPCFLLPLFSYLISAECDVNCQKFIELRCLSYTLVALSSYDKGVRSAACHILSNFFNYIQTSRFQAKSQIIYILQCLQNSLTTIEINSETETIPRICCVVTQFLARTVMLLLHPENYMYRLVNGFMLLKPSMDIANVPEFYKLFNSSSFENKIERSWMLSLLLDGLHDLPDYRVFEKRYIFKLLLSFFNSPMSTSKSQEQVLSVIQRACSIHTIARDLAKNHGLLTWLHSVITSSKDCTVENVTQLVGVLHELWQSMLTDQNSRSTSKPSKLPATFTNHMLLTLLALLKNTRSFCNLETFSQYTNCLSSVLQHQSVNLDPSRGHLKKAPIKMITPDILLLLVHWSSLTGEKINGAESIENVGKLKDDKRSTAKSEEVQVDNVSSDEKLSDKDGDNNNEANRYCHREVSECALIRILTHWTPVANEGSINCDKMAVICCWYLDHVSDQARTSHCLLCLAEPLRWFEKNISPLCELIGDCLMEASSVGRVVHQLLKLYNQLSLSSVTYSICDRCHKLTSPHMTCFQLRDILNTVILNIFESTSTRTSLADHDCMLSAILQKDAYRSVAAAIADIDDHVGGAHVLRSTSLSMLLQEAWLNIPQPLHAPQSLSF